MTQRIRSAHSPDSDDAFMFYALAAGRIDTGDLQYVHELADIETLNRRALAGELEVTAVSIHAYAYLADRYALLSSGCSMGDGYGPRLVSREPAPPEARAALGGRGVGHIIEQLPYPALPVYIQHVDPNDAAPPIPYQPTIELTEGPHFGYALQWFTFATILLVGYPFYLRTQEEK